MTSDSVCTGFSGETTVLMALMTKEMVLPTAVTQNALRDAMFGQLWKGYPSTQVCSLFDGCLAQATSSKVRQVHGFCVWIRWEMKPTVHGWNAFSM